MYSRNRAVEYAKKWWNSRNPQFYDFDKLGGDCTNFVSQCLYFGGIEMLYSPLGWYYNSLNSRSPSWAGVDEFFSFSTNNQNILGVKAKQVLSQNTTGVYGIDVGDVVQLRFFDEDRFHHTALITKMTNDGIFITCHTNDALDKPLSYYPIKEIRFLKILNDQNNFVALT